MKWNGGDKMDKESSGSGWCLFGLVVGAIAFVGFVLEVLWVVP